MEYTVSYHFINNQLMLCEYYIDNEYVYFTCN